MLVEIGDERQNALCPNRGETFCVGLLAYAWRGIDFPISRMKDGAERRADRKRATFGDRMRHGDKFDIERPNRDGRSLGDDGDWNLRRARLGEALGFEKRGGEARRVEVAFKLRPRIRDRANVVLMRMSNDEAHQIAPHLFDEADIRNDEVYPWEIGAREGYAAIDHQPFDAPFAAEAIKSEVHADLAEASERHKDELVTSIVHLHKPFLDHDHFNLILSWSLSFCFIA